MKFGIVPRDYWTDPKFRRLSSSSKLVLMYLMTCPEGNSPQLFQVLPDDIAVRTGLDVAEVESCMQILAENKYLQYDPETPLVWLESAMRRELGDRMKFDDKRVKHVRRIVEHLPVSAIRADFLKRYAVVYHLITKKTSGKSKPLSGDVLSEGGFEGTSEEGFDASLEGSLDTGFEGDFTGSLQDKDKVKDNSEYSQSGEVIEEEDRDIEDMVVDGWDEEVNPTADDWTEDPDVPAVPNTEPTDEWRLRV